MTKSTTLNYGIVALATIALVLATAAPAFAAINSSSIKVRVDNRGVIDNETTADSHTGHNFAWGSYGGRGGDGGEVDGDDGNNNNGGATAGNGGAGGNANAGGFVETGNADSEATTQNVLNDTAGGNPADSNDAGLDLTGAAASGLNSSDVEVEVDNDKDCDCNRILNKTRGDARSGANIAKGSVGGNGDDGGEVDGDDGNNNNGGASAGNGGNGGTSDIGGTVKTGSATSRADSINLLNTTFFRVRL